MSPTMARSRTRTSANGAPAISARCLASTLAQRLAHDQDLREAGEPVPDLEAVDMGFADDYDLAAAKAEATVANNLYEQTRDSPTTVLGWLKMRWPDRYRETQALEISGPRGAPIAITPALAAIPGTN